MTRTLVRAFTLILASNGVAQESALAQESDEWWTALDAGPGVHVAEVDSLYRISGFTHDDMYREMQRNGPGADEIGVRLGVHYSEWRWSFRYRQPPGGRCHLSEARVLLRSTVILPEWTNVSTARPELARGWREFLAALRTHEEGHRSRAKAQGVFLWQSLLGLEAGSCDDLQTLVEDTANRVIEEGRAAQLDYDRDTGHGKTQGAVWPPPGGVRAAAIIGPSDRGPAPGAGDPPGRSGRPPTGPPRGSPG